MSVRERIRERAREIEREMEVEEERRVKEAVPTVEVRDLYTLVRAVAPYHGLLLYGLTGTGKTTFCYALAREAVNYGVDVVYVDTEGNIHWRIPDKVMYFNVGGLDDLKAVVSDIVKRVKSEELGKDGLLLIIDSIEAPIVRKASRAAGFHERAAAYLERAGIGSRILDLALEFRDRKKPFTAVFVEHARSPIGMTRVLEQVAKKYLERRRVMTPEELPPEIRLLGMVPKGGSFLYFIKERWVTERLEADVREDYRRTTFGIYAYSSRCFAPMERIMTLTIETIYGRGIRIRYKIEARPFPAFEVSPDIMREE